VSSVTDFLVIGSGAAGLSFALRAADSGSVTVITKKLRADSNTNYAQGGIAAVFDTGDSFDSHIADTIKAGVDLCYTKAVHAIVREGPGRINDLVRWGVLFTQDESSNNFDLGMEGGHSKPRIVHAMDKTGKVVETALLEKVMAHPNIQVLENHSAVELITEHHLTLGGKTTRDRTHCWGAYALDGDSGKVKTFLAQVTLLASGGAGQVYLHTTNPSIATGDGIAMAHRAGAAVGNLEFIQFHPTSLYHEEGDSFLISEAVRGFGGILRNSDGEPFMKQYHQRADLAPRDIVARAIDAEMKRRGDACMFLDVTHLDADSIKKRFPQINGRLTELKIDMTKELIPVVPSAHYMCGGVVTDLSGRSTIDGLYVTGETAFTGVHGANRLASNSLLEAIVFSQRACASAVEYMKNSTAPIPSIPPWSEEGTYNQEEWVLISHDRKELRRLMWDYVGIVRNTERLNRAGDRIDLTKSQIEDFYKKTRVTPELIELRNISHVASLVIQCALFRKESRGLHYTTDYPDRDDKNWMGNTVIWRDEISFRPIDSTFNAG